MLTFSRRLFSLNFLEGRVSIVSYIDLRRIFPGEGSRARGDGDRGGAGGEGGVFLF